MKINKFLLLALLIVPITLLFLTKTNEEVQNEEVNIYTSRHYDADNFLYEQFTKKTGIKVNIISGKGSALIERLKAEGINSPGDVFFTVDAGNLANFQKQGFLQSIQSEIIKQSVPVELRGENDEWVAVAKRARVIFYNPELVSEGEIKDINYEDLASDVWKNGVAIRSSSNMYNQSLVSSLISNLGIDETEKWAKGLVSNFARKPQGNDRSQIMAVANKEASIAIANTYYIGIMLSGKGGKEQLNAAQKVKIVFPNQNNRGTHINVSGGGVLKHSPNRENAEKFLEFLLSEEAQVHIVNNTFEYPVLESVKPHPIIESFGDFKMDKTSIADFGKYNPEAVKLMDRVSWQ
ncbi:MAG: extracellular solute-binding protein [Candidatus Marinimicrobia bacterium]|jgi:iron(III) transport system substrate-binding protein|nr:extracellular solute-binding protein [Candidatus Neomarinimicrobiota bacterium]